MSHALSRHGLKLFSTCPPSNGAPSGDYLRRVADIARWSEAAGCEGILVYTDNGLVDPWLLSQSIIEATQRLCPLVAVQPAYMHPYSVAKMVASIAFMHGRRVYLNMVAGGFRNDLVALNDLQLRRPERCELIYRGEYEARTTKKRKAYQWESPYTTTQSNERCENIVLCDLHDSVGLIIPACTLIMILQAG